MSASIVCQMSLTIEESCFYRDRLRAARYAALADAEGFTEICFAVESLGMRLLKKQKHLGDYTQCVSELADLIPDRAQLAQDFPGCFARFCTLYEILRNARNEVMHTGTYARHATSAAIALCIHLEEALMAVPTPKPSKVKDYMVREVVSVKSWQPVAHARQLMLTHSFSFLPVETKSGWKLLSEMSVASFLREHRPQRLAMSINDAVLQDSGFLGKAKEVRPDCEIADLFKTTFNDGARLWLITEADGSDRLLGVLSPFELM